MSTTLTLMQTAGVLGISVAETLRLVRRKLLKVAHVTNNVKHFASADILSYINSTH